MIQTQAHDTHISHISIPFIKNTLLDVGYFYLPFVSFVVVGSSNAVNLTDGLDGLAIVLIGIVAACFGIISYVEQS
jgi:phospho-N-acetylmuramoyl-pentapeptide-transferase